MKTTKTICITAAFTALCVVLSSFSVPVPGGHLYLNDIAICTAALLLPPLPAVIAGGVGAFLGDLIFYPAPMFVSLVTRGIQALVISLFARKKDKTFLFSFIGLMIGAIIMVAGYSLGREFIYGAKGAWLVKLPFQIAQALTGVAVSLLLCFKTPVRKVFNEKFGDANTSADENDAKTENSETDALPETDEQSKNQL